MFNFKNIFDKKKLNSKISSSNQFETSKISSEYVGLLNALQFPACIIEKNHNLLVSNAKLIELWPNLKLNELITLYVRNPNFIEALNDVTVNNNPKNITFVLKQSFDRMLECQISSILTQDNSYILIVMRDLTAAAKIEQMRVDFVANASHELKTPIAALLGFIETLQGAAKYDSKASEKFLAIMHTQAKRMSRLVNDLLSLNKMEMLEHLPVEDVVNMAELLSEVVNFTNSIAESAGIKLRTNILAQKTNVLGDKDALFRIIENILSNAIKYGEGGKFVDITLENTFDNTRISLTVQDYGCGIAKEHLPRLTERFYRVDEARSREKGGTGLGLAIVKHCINRHKGTLKFESELGKGLRVEISLLVVV